jgi:hypothetical protein
MNTAAKKAPMENAAGIDGSMVITADTSCVHEMNIKLIIVVDGRPRMIPPILELNFSEIKMVNAIYNPPTRNERISLMMNGSMGMSILSLLLLI